MDHLASAKASRIDDRKRACIALNTSPFTIVDSRQLWRRQMVHFIISQILHPVEGDRLCSA